MPGWNDTFDESLQWHRTEFLNMFRAAMRERYAALWGDAAAASAIPDITAGDNVQQATLYRNWQSMDWLGFASSKYISPDALQGRENFLDPPPPILTTFGPPPRRRPREVASRSATADIQGNPAAIGQFAYLVTVSGFGDVTSHGPVVTYDGTKWVDAAGPVDVLRSDAAPPYHVEPGLMVQGDYIGHWIFNDLRDRINQLTATHAYWVPDDISMKSAQSSALESIDAAKADAIAKWNASSSSDAYGYFTFIRPSGSRYVAGIVTSSHRALMWASTGLIPNVPDTTMARQIEFYIYGHDPSVILPGDATFDNNGYPLVEGEWNLWETIGPTTTRYPATTSYIGSTSTPPNWPPSANGARHGFVGATVFEAEPFFGGRAVIRWDVEGGFAYTVDT